MKLQRLNIVFRLLEHSDIPNATNLLAQTFVQREPLGVALDDSYELAHAFALDLCEKAVQQKLGMVAMDTLTHDIVGCMICQDYRADAQYKPDSHHDPKGAIAMALLGELRKPLEQWTHEVGVLCHLVMIAVQEAYTQQGIATQLMLYMLQYLKQLGFEYVFAECTNPWSYQMMLHLDGGTGKDLKEIYFKDFEFEGEKVFINSTGKAILRINHLDELLSHANIAYYSRGYIV